MPDNVFMSTYNTTTHTTDDLPTRKSLTYQDPNSCTYQRCS